MYIIEPIPYKILSSNVFDVETGLTPLNASGLGGRGKAGTTDDDTQIPFYDPPRYNPSGKLNTNGERIPYVFGDLVSSPPGDGSLNNIYIATANANQGNAPAATENNNTIDPDEEYRIQEDLLNPTRKTSTADLVWNFVTKMNNSMLFDNNLTYATGRKDLIEFEISTDSSADAIFFEGIQATKISYSFMRDGDLFEDEEELDDITSIQNHEDYLKAPLELPTRWIFFPGIKLPLTNHPDKVDSQNTRLRIRIENPGGVATCSQFGIGKETKIGIVDAKSMKQQIIDYTQNVIDKYGGITTVPGHVGRTMQFDVIFERNRTDFVNRLIIGKGQGRRALFYATRKQEFGSTIYGYLSSNDISSYPSNNTNGVVRIGIQGLTA